MNRVFQKNYVEDWWEEFVEDGPWVPARVWEDSCWHFANREVEVEVADGGDSRKEKSVSLSVFMDVNNLEVEEEWSTMATLSLGGRRVDGQLEEGAAEGVEEAVFVSTDIENR